jgi:protoporphyrinogen IX oxidase
MAYLWIKTVHIVLIASWFAGLFYLPRIFVNLAMETEPAATQRLLLMANKLYRFMTILMVPALALGLILWLYYGVGQQSLWMHVKLLIVLVLVGYHHLCKRLLKTFERGENVRSHVWYRWFNELPVIGMFAAVALVIIKPV